MAQNHTPDEMARERRQKLGALRHREEERAAETRAQASAIPYGNLTTMPIDGEALTFRPLEDQQRAEAAIIRRDDHHVTVAARDVSSPAFAAFRSALEKEGLTLALLTVSEASLAHVWGLYKKFAYLKTRVTGEVRIDAETLARLREEILDIRDLTDRLRSANAQDISVLVELVLAGAMRLDASDIHVEPQEDGGAKIRFRLDGVLHDLTLIRRDVYRLLLERVKLLSGLKLNVGARGQDGRFTIKTDREIEIRASTLPGKNGEFIVLRVLNPERLLDIAELGLREDLLGAITEELKRPNGMILTTGPTGSGKTTMLYAFLKRVTTPELKIITIEDPVEYQLSGIEQTQVDPEAGYTFDVGLRSIVRQDPDIVLVGEVRDRETASIAMHAALTGHLVFSTLHTNDAAGAIPRLLDLGIDPTVVGPALNVVMAQRLIRRVCKSCSKTASPSASVAKAIRSILALLPPAVHAPDLTRFTLRETNGCAECHGTGYRGRIGVFELFSVDEEVERLTLKKPSVAEIRAFGVERGMVTLQQDALLRALEGITTIDEIVRVTGPLTDPRKAEVPLEPEENAEKLARRAVPKAKRR